MMRRFAIAVILVWPCVAQQGRSEGVGTIAGNLTGEDGTVITGGFVVINQLPPYPSARVQNKQWRTLTGANGIFRVDGLPAGQYRVCAELRNSRWLNPCEWGLQAPVVTLSSAQPAGNISVVLKKGVALPIRLDDPGQRLSQNERAPDAHLLIGVANDAKVFRPALVVSRDASGRNHEVVIPFNYTVKVVVYSSSLRLADVAGVPLTTSAATHIPVSVTIGAAPATITLKVTGGK